MYFGSFPHFEDFSSGQSRQNPRKNVDTTGFYKILNLEKNCSESDIKRAYRKLAIRHHPDKGGDPETFKKIGQAYDALSDPKKRKIYDTYGEEGLEGNTTSDPSEVFDLFFGSRKSRKGPDIVTNLKVTLEQIYSGCVRKMAINKDTICAECDGVGGPSEMMERCSPCNGQGIQTQLRQMGPMVSQTQTVCQACKGAGKIMPKVHKCRKCDGGGTVKERKILEVDIEKGISNRDKIPFKGEADERPGEIPGDVVFVIEQQPHSVFKRRGNDLIMTKTISLYEALTGFKTVITHLDDRKLYIKTEPGEIIRPETVRSVNEEGMPTHGRPFDRGNLLIIFQVDFPDALSKDAMRKLQDILPAPSTMPIIDEDDEMLEHHTMVEVDPESLKGNPNNNQSNDEDDGDDGHGGHPKMQCTQQ